jgi:hypothetical protein
MGMVMLSFNLNGNDSTNIPTTEPVNARIGETKSRETTNAVTMPRMVPCTDFELLYGILFLPTAPPAVEATTSSTQTMTIDA